MDHAEILKLLFPIKDMGGTFAADIAIEGGFLDALQKGSPNLLTANQANVETDLTGLTSGWYHAAVSAISRTTALNYNGLACVEVAAGADATGVELGNFTAFPAAAAGKDYTAQARVKGTALDEFKIVIGFFDAVNTSLSYYSTTLIATGEWDLTSVSHLAPATTAKVTIAVRRNGASANAFYVDCLQIEAADQASYWVDPEIFTPGAEKLLLGLFPDTCTAATIEEWERTYAIVPPDGATLAARRLAVVQKKRLRRKLNRAYFVSLAETVGYTVTIEERPPNDATYGGGWETIYIWIVHVPIGAKTITYFTAGDSSAGDLLADWTGESILETLFEALKPAHTRVIFLYE